MSINGLLEVIILSLATAVIAVTITKAGVFEWLRVWVFDRNEFLGELFHCSYCMSHWVAFAMVLIYRPVIIPRYSIIDFFVSAFVMVAFSSIIAGFIKYLNGFMPSPTRDSPAA